MTTHNIKCNAQKRTYTIYTYENGKLQAISRSIPQGEKFKAIWTETDIKRFLSDFDQYYILANLQCGLYRRYGKLQTFRDSFQLHWRVEE